MKEKVPVTEIVGNCLCIEIWRSYFFLKKGELQLWSTRLFEHVKKRKFFSHKTSRFNRSIHWCRSVDGNLGCNLTETPIPRFRTVSWWDIIWSGLVSWGTFHQSFGLEKTCDSYLQPWPNPELNRNSPDEVSWTIRNFCRCASRCTIGSYNP